MRHPQAKEHYRLLLVTGGGEKKRLPRPCSRLPGYGEVIFNEKLTSTSLILVFWTAKMEEGSRDMKGFAEQYYWNYSASYRFLNVMDHNFSQQMTIPEKFVKNFNEDLVGSYVLKGPSGNFWLVKLQKVGDDLQFKDGWKEFVESHYIGEGDILTFEYEGNSCFNVLIYDASGCEREMSYLAKNHKNVLADEARFSKKQSAENSAENIQKTQPPNNYQSHSRRVQSLNDEWADRRRKTRKVVPSVHPIIHAENMFNHPPQTHHEIHSSRVPCDDNLQMEQLSPQQFPLSNAKATSKSHIDGCAKKRINILEGDSSVHPTDSAENMHKLPSQNADENPSQRVASDDIPSLTVGLANCRRRKRKVGCPRKLAPVPINQEDIQLSGLPSPPPSVQLISKRRPVTNEEKDKTWRLASAVKLANPSFRVMMRETHVYKRFFMTIPAEFVAEHLHGTWTAANLHIHNERGSWLDVICNYQGSSLGLYGLKWRNFVQVNNLEEGDVCIFELTNATGVNLVFSVRIFRVVDEVIPLENISFLPKGSDPLKK